MDAPTCRGGAPVQTRLNCFVVKSHRSPKKRRMRLGSLLYLRLENRQRSLTIGEPVPSRRCLWYKQNRGHSEGVMVAGKSSNQSLCIYCGQCPTKRIRKGEHILQAAIGGALTITEKSGRAVCHECNNGVLSLLDRELCGRSLLSAVASQELSAEMWQVWDVDHASRNLLVEAKPAWDNGELLHLVTYPQITLERSGPEIRGDALEFERFGREEAPKVLAKAVRRAFQRYCAGEKRVLHFERMHSDVHSRGYRFAPRVFTRHSIFEIAHNIHRQSFIIRATSPEDQRFALLSLARLEEGQRFNRLERIGGSYTAQLSHSYDLGLTMRALMKLGVNLLAAYCQKTPVNGEAFKEVVKVIRGETPTTPEMLKNNGFVRAVDIEPLKSADKSHSFRLVYLNGSWMVYSSFFGGRIGAAVSFPGPNREGWNTMNVVAPLHDKNWQVVTSALLQPMRVHIEWSGLPKIAPSLKLQSSSSKLIAEKVRVGK